MMKLSIVLSAQPASFSALTYQGQLEENVNKIREMGFDGVELAVRDPELVNISELKKQLHRHSLRVPAIGTGQLFGEEGLSLTDPDPEIRTKARKRLIRHMELAENLNSLVIIGLVRGKEIPDGRKNLAENWLQDGLTESALANPHVRIAVEPINRYETVFLNTVNETIEFLDRIDMPNVGMLLDTFHMNIEEPSIEESIRRCGKRIFHIHVADSNRWYPGAGHIDFGSILSALKDAQYTGFFSGEMLPLPDPDTSAREMVQFFRNMES